MARFSRPAELAKRPVYGRLVLVISCRCCENYNTFA
jgi:hypothetical protein